MIFYDVKDKNNQPKPFVPILGVDEYGEVHEYWFANGYFHTPDNNKTTKNIILWAKMPQVKKEIVCYEK